MIMEIRDNGIAVVTVKSREEEIYLAAAIVSILQRTPELSALVSAVMAGKMSFTDLGIDIIAKELNGIEDTEKAIRTVQEEQPAEDSDIPDFVKRSLHE